MLMDRGIPADPPEGSPRGIPPERVVGCWLWWDPLCRRLFSTSVRPSVKPVPVALASLAPASNAQAGSSSQGDSRENRCRWR